MKYQSSIGDCPFDYGGHQFYEMIFKNTSDPYSGVRGKELNYCKKCGIKKRELEK